MRLRLEHFKKTKKQFSQDELDRFKTIIQTGDWQALINHVEDCVSVLSDQDSERQHIYEFVFEYAILEGQTPFIKNIVNHENVIQYLHHGVVYAYAIGSGDDDFQDKIFALMLTHEPKYNIWYYSSYDQFVLAVGLYFDNSLSQKGSLVLEKIIKCYLYSPKIEANRIGPYYMNWIIEFAKAFSNKSISEEQRNEFKRVFYQYLPEDKPSLLQFLKFLLRQTEDFFLETVDTLLKKHQLNDTEIKELIYDSYHPNVEFVARLTLELNESDPITLYNRAISELKQLKGSDRRAFILSNCEVLFSPQLPPTLQRDFRTLDVEDIRIINEYCIENVDSKIPFEQLAFGVHHYDDELLLRLLNTRHLSIPEDFLYDLILGTNTIKDHEKIIKALLLRNDYSLTRENLFKPLLTLFLKGDVASLNHLLNNKNVFDLLARFYELKGDDCLSMETRGSLMTNVIAWYVWKDLDKAYTLFSSIEEEQRQPLLRGFVPCFIDSNAPTLHITILRSGNAPLINCVGGFNPRFFQRNASGKLLPVLPDVFSNSRISDHLIQIQRRIAVEYAKSRSSELSYADKDNEIEELAHQAALNYHLQPVILHHLTAIANSSKILDSGKLRSRRHIEGHSLEGELSKGLTGYRSWTVSENAQSSFVYFTHVSDVENHVDTTHAPTLSIEEKVHFVMNLEALINDNPQITFLVIGPYNHFKEKTLTLPSGEIFRFDPADLTEAKDMQLVELPKNSTACFAIYQKLFELVFYYFINNLSKNVRSEITQKLINPKSTEDRKLANDFINLLPLEWLIPGDIPLKLTYVERIDYAGKTYSLATLRNAALTADENEVLRLISESQEITLFPFVVDGVLEIAQERHQYAVCNELNKLKNRKEQTIIFYPNEIYQIESLVQLILEDLNDERVIVSYNEEELHIKSILRVNNNRGGAHHAEMAKLHCALGIGDVYNKNAMGFSLPETLTLPIGKNKQSQLTAVRNALLTYEVSSLLASYQNQKHYEKHEDFHPITGRGACNGEEALLKYRLFKDDNSYHINVTTTAKNAYVIIESTLPEATSDIANAIEEIMQLAREKILTQDSRIIVTLPVWDFIIKLRASAIFYEGINVITSEGQLLLANRNNRGLASAGGHHGDKYTRKGAAYGLYSEFGLKIKNTCLNQVELLENVQSHIRTGNYVVPYEIVNPTPQAQFYSQQQQMKTVFNADTREFELGSEVALTLSEMRGKIFYDVMPLAELCHYQLNKLNEVLAQQFTDDFKNMTIAIDTGMEMIRGADTMHKIPSNTFGRITISSQDHFSEDFEKILEISFTLTSDDQSEIKTYVTDESPFVLKNFITNSFQSLSINK